MKLIAKSKRVCLFEQIYARFKSLGLSRAQMDAFLTDDHMMEQFFSGKISILVSDCACGEKHIGAISKK